MKKRMIALILVVAMFINTVACTTGTKENATLVEDSTENTVFTENMDTFFEDNDLLYANDDDTSVITMYLTVTKGNASENTNHTWEEVNSYSAYDYEEMGVERYAVNGLLQVGDENGPLKGELGYGKYIPNATVTIRGQTSTRNVQKNYKIKLKDDAGTWNDQQTINLNKHQGDGLRFRNKLAYDLLEELPGMIALQTQFVHLYVKDETQKANAEFEDYGFYTQVEQPNKRFLERHGLDKNGHLYKINFFEFHRYEDVIMLKSDAGYDAEAFEYMIEIKGDDNHSKLIRMLEDLNDETKEIDEILENWFEVDNLASWMAFHILMGNTDTQSRNTLLYSPLNLDKWYFISWDNDGSLMETQTIVRRGIDEKGWEYGICNYWGNVLFQRAFKSEKFRNVLDEKIELFYSLITEEKLQTMIASYAEVVQPFLYRGIDRYYAPLTEEEYEYVCKQTPKEVAHNYELYKESYEVPMPFFIGVPKVENNTVEFTWENSYSFDNENVFYSFELADNLEFANAIVSEENIFVPGYTYEGKLEPGQYFVRVKAVNESGKEQYAFDYYVTSSSQKHYGIISFYVMPDGSIGVEENEE